MEVKTPPHNQKLSTLLARLQAEASAARSEADLLRCVQQAVDFGAPIQYRNALWWWLSAAALAASCALFLYRYQNQPVVSGSEYLFMGVVIGLATLAPLGVVLYRANRIRRLSRLIWERNVAFDNGLVPVAIGNGDALANQWQRRFAEFDRGNYRQTIDRCHHGHYQGDTYAFEYDLFDFHYVDREVRTTTDSKGRTRTQVVYHHYHRYGLILPFGYVQRLNLIGFRASGHRGENWQPASSDFNRAYKVLGHDEMTAARFLKPAVVERLTQFAGQLKRVNFEFNGQGDLCLSFADSDLLDAPHQADLRDPVRFAAEIAGKSSLPKLNAALGTVHYLMTHSDNNFTHRDQPVAATTPETP